MNDSDEKTLEALSTRGRRGPGEVKLYHLEGPEEPYILKKWHKSVGDSLGIRELLATIETKSFTLDVESFEEGTVGELCFRVGENVPSGATIAKITNSRRNA